MQKFLFRSCERVNWMSFGKYRFSVSFLFLDRIFKEFSFLFSFHILLQQSGFHHIVWSSLIYSLHFVGSRPFRFDTRTVPPRISLSRFHLPLNLSSRSCQPNRRICIQNWVEIFHICDTQLGQCVAYAHMVVFFHFFHRFTFSSFTGPFFHIEHRIDWKWETGVLSSHRAAANRIDEEIFALKIGSKSFTSATLCSVVPQVVVFFIFFNVSPFHIHERTENEKTCVLCFTQSSQRRTHFWETTKGRLQNGGLRLPNCERSFGNKFRAYAKEALNFVKRIARIIEGGCGSGALFDVLKQNENVESYLGVDFSEEMIDICNSKKNQSVDINASFGLQTRKFIRGREF